ncbi:MAG TPA: T9SS type A sorting domain-containing protein [Rubricoccaceae bacterium]
MPLRSLRYPFALALLGLVLAPAALAQTFGVVPSPNAPSGGAETFNTLRGVGAVSASDAWAVGEWHDTRPSGQVDAHTLAMHWDGAAWTIAPTPNPDPVSSVLWDVEVVSPTVAWAAGSKGTNARPLMLRWNGMAWAEASLPPLGSGNASGTLLDMHALSADNVWAVGEAGNWGTPTPGTPSFVALAFHWNGSTWSATMLPFVGTYRDRLSAVHASAPDNVWAVGSYGSSAGVFRPLVYRFDGTAWHAMPAPFNGDPTRPLHSVAVLAPDDVWVTADRIADGAVPVTAHWDGTSWTEHANPSGTGALIAVRTDDVFGFGTNVTHWDGASWTVFDDLGGVPGASLHASELTANGDMWAVGRTIPGDQLQTLTVRAAGLRPGAVAGEPAAGSALESGMSIAPNPSDRLTTVTLVVARPSSVVVAVYDALGRRVVTLHDGALSAGSHMLPLDTSELPAGVYVIRATGATPVSRRLVVTR